MLAHGCGNEPANAAVLRRQCQRVLAGNSLPFRHPERRRASLSELRDALKPRGVLFCSNPRGIDEEGWSGDRYGCYFEINRWRQLISTAGFAEIDHYYRPAGLPRYEQPWLAMLWSISAKPAVE